MSTRKNRSAQRLSARNSGRRSQLSAEPESEGRNGSSDSTTDTGTEMERYIMATSDSTDHTRRKRLAGAMTTCHQHVRDAESSISRLLAPASSTLCRPTCLATLLDSSAAERIISNTFLLWCLRMGLAPAAGV